MNLKAVFIYIGHILRIEGALMLPALVLALANGERNAALGFGAAMAVCLLSGFLLARMKRDGSGLGVREGFVTVSLGWIFLSLAGALPFLISGAIPSVIDSWFETVSGFTTTGASILTEVESLPVSILYWRSFTHWIGGMGVLVFMLAIVPQSRGNGETFHLLRAESPGPSVGKLTPTLRHTARILYSIYIAMTLLEIVLLLFGGMPLFDSIVNAFGTAGTGGFAIKNASIAAYGSAYIEAVIGVFMMLFGVNFSIFYLLLLRQFRAVLKNEELRWYLIIMAGATLLIALDILHMYTDVGTAFLDSFFQVSSIMTTTGFATANYDVWPETSRFLLVLLMIFGASAGSTGGGMKISRVLILVKSLRTEATRMIRPRAVRPVRLDGKALDSSIVHGTYAFLVAYLALSLLSMFIVAFDDFSRETTVTSVLACINNIGPGLDLVGPTGNYSQFSWLSKLVLSADMLFGRLEIFPMLMLASRSIWKRKRA